MAKRLSTIWETQVWSLGQKDPLEKEMATQSSTIAWNIPRTEEPGGLHSMGSQTVWHDWVTSLSLSFTLYKSRDREIKMMIQAYKTKQWINEIEN